MKIVIDAMGGDHAPDEVVRGAAHASRWCAGGLVLVGDERRIGPILEAEGATTVEVVHTDEWIAMDEAVGTALRSRKKASMVMAASMVRAGGAQGFVCAGNTAALHQVALTGVGRLPGIKRPALAVVFPTRNHPTLGLDMGANAECKPEWLVQFAVMGSIYAEKVLERSSPRVALLSIGGEAGKGNSLVAAAADLLAGSGLNFVGNVEPGAFFHGEVDVAVSDGFTGNMMLKTGEAVAEWFMDHLRKAARSSVPARIGGLLMKPALMALRQEADHSEHGGAVLLGLRGVVIKCHGRSSARAIENGIRVAEQVIRNRVVEQIEASLSGSAPGDS